MDALDLCLACKGCKGDCPVNVDMATYKAEFLSHYYERRIRPRHAYSMGLIYWWARLASRRAIAGESDRARTGPQQRDEVPGRHRATTYHSQVRRRDFHIMVPAPLHPEPSELPVLLWPDTFNNYFHPNVAKAAVEVLEHAGYRVTIPDPSLCCGRPLYDFGMLKTARSLLQQILTELGPQIQAGMPMIGLEPSCLAVFRDEMVNLLPQDWNAKRLHKQCFTLAEFLETHQKINSIPKLPRKAIVHGHCHHKAIMTMKAEEDLYDKVGLNFEVLDSGCCGMAGSFGFEKDHYAVSVACGDRKLIPEVRKADEQALIIADGFSCHEQIVQLTGKTPKHTAEVLRMAIHGGGEPPFPSPPRRAVSRGVVVAGVLLGIAAAFSFTRMALFASTKRMNTYGRNRIRSSRPALDRVGR